MQTVQDVRAAPRPRLAATPHRSSTLLCLLAALVAVGIATSAFLYGNQPLFSDASEYLNLAHAIVTRGPASFASELRTYGYPAVLAAILLVVGQDQDTVRIAVFAAQLAALIAVCWIGARRLNGALGTDGSWHAFFVVTVLNPFLLLHSVQVLTDLPAALCIYIAAVLGLPQRRSESARRVCLLAAASLVCAGFAVMLRPASLAVVPVVTGIWLARVALRRDAHWLVVPVGLLALTLPFVPQVWSNYRVFRVASPLIVRSLYREQMVWGLQYAKYGTLVLPGLPNTLFYDNPFKPAGEPDPARVLSQEPGAYAATLALHAFALVDQDYPLTYIRNVDPWYRWPLSVLNYLFLLAAPVGTILGWRGSRGQPADELRRRRFSLLALGATALAVIAIYLPTAVESRFSLPLYPLLAGPAVLAVRTLPARLPAAGATRLTLATVGVVIWLGGFASLSIWLQQQAPLLVGVRDGTLAPGAAGRRLPGASIQPSAQAPGQPAPTQPPPHEIPLTTYTVEVPRELTVRRTVDLDVTVTNTGQETWSVKGEYPVNLAVRFEAQSTELYERVKGLMRDSQSADLPNDVAPGESATVHLSFVAPPEPGRYTMILHVTRIGVPDSKTRVERVVRVVDRR